MFGDSSDPETHHPPPLHEIKLWNFYHVANHTTTATISTIEKQIHPYLTVERNGTVVHRDTYTLPDEGWNVLGISYEEWMGCGRYEVTTGLRDESRETTVDSAEFEPSEVTDGTIQPIRLDVGYHPEGFEIGPVYLDEPRVECEEETTGEEW